MSGSVLASRHHSSSVVFTIFSRVNLSLMNKNSFFSQMLAAKRDPNLTAEQRSIITQLFSKVESGAWTTYGSAEYHMKLIFGGVDDAGVAFSMGLSHNTVRINRQRMSRELGAIYGSDFFEMLYSGRPRDLQLLQQRINYGGVSRADTLLIPGVLSSIRMVTEDSTDSYDVTQLVPEIEFLQRYSNAQLQRELEQLDVQGLRYLVDMLDNKRGTLTDRAGLYSKVVM